MKTESLVFSNSASSLSKGTESDLYSYGAYSTSTYSPEKIKVLISDLQNQILALEDKQRVIKENFERDKKEYIKELQEAKTKAIESLGIFVSLFTFISITFQIFSHPIKPELIYSILLLLFGCLAAFVVMVNILLRRNDSNLVSFETIQAYDNKRTAIIFWTKLKYLFINETSLILFLILSLLSIIIATSIVIKSNEYDSFNDSRLQTNLSKYIN